MSTPHPPDNRPGWDDPRPPPPPYGDPSGLPYGVPAGDGVSATPYDAESRVDRPGTVLAGAIMTYVGCALPLLVGLVFLLIGMAASPEDVDRAARGTPVADLAPEAVRGALLAIGAVAAVLAVIVIALAVFAQKGRGGARIALTVIGGIIIALAVADLVTGSPLSMAAGVWVAGVIVLLWVGGANEWYRSRKAAP